MARLVRGPAGVVSSVSFASGLISVVVELGSGDVVLLRHRVGARAGISLSASRILWLKLVAARDNEDFVEFSGRAGWDGWFDGVDVVTFLTLEDVVKFRLTTDLRNLPKDDEEELKEYLDEIAISAYNEY